MLPLVPAILTIYSIVQTRRYRRNQEEKELLKEIKDGLDEFVSDVLSWYNRLIEYAIPIIRDVELGALREPERLRRIEFFKRRY